VVAAVTPTNQFRLPAFPPGRDAVSLFEVLSVLPHNNWSWRLKHFEGTGNAPKDMHMMDFEHLTQLECGLEFQWDELLAFSKELNQIIDGDLTASSHENGGEPIIFIEVFDSAAWTIKWSHALDLKPALTAIVEGNTR
jgi:hypothetical protein